MNTMRLYAEEIPGRFVSGLGFFYALLCGNAATAGFGQGVFSVGCTGLKYGMTASDIAGGSAVWNVSKAGIRKLHTQCPRCTVHYICFRV
ncbi:MAG TPA: hypothetical protein DF613_10600 [Lachnospiraceae bacterium]|nr:hypothetical protein [Lachnospiraceae bacterium]